MGFQGLINPLGELAQGNVRMLRPVSGQKVVVKDVHQNAPVMAIAGVHAVQTAADDGIALGETVDPPMQFNAPSDSEGPGVVQSPFDEIAHQAAEQAFNGPVRKIEMKQIVQPPKPASVTVERQLMLFRLLRQFLTNFRLVSLQFAGYLIQLCRFLKLAVVQ